MPKKPIQASVDRMQAVDEAEKLGVPVAEKPAKKPKPGDKNFDWAAEYGTADLYVHTFPDGKVVALKQFNSIFSKTWMYKIRHLKTNIDIELAALDRGSCEKAQLLLETLDETGDYDPISELWDGWSGKATNNGDGDDGLSSGN